MKTAALTCFLAAGLGVLLFAVYAPHFSLSSSNSDILLFFAAISFAVGVVAAFAWVLLGIRELFHRVTRRTAA